MCKTFMISPRQLELSLWSHGDESASSGGLISWHEERRREVAKMSRCEGVPLGRKVRVDFAASPPIEGILELDESLLFYSDIRDSHLRLRIGAYTFHKNECEALVVLD